MLVTAVLVTAVLVTVVDCRPSYGYRTTCVIPFSADRISGSPGAIKRIPAQETYLTMRFAGHRSATIADRDVSGIIKCSLDHSLPATAHIQ
jgi:hypothetical protein